MAKPLTPARRAELAVEAYALSLKGYSAREIGRKLGVHHNTVSSFLRKESERRAAERPDARQWAIDSYQRIVRRCWESLDQNPSPHATAQLAHACNSALDSITLIDGTRAPARSQKEVTVEIALERALAQGMGRLSDEELAILALLLRKSQGSIDDDIPTMIRAGSIVLSDDILELEPLGEDPEDGY